ncbi:MAG: double-strand break repair protein AddB [Sneathiella sp.]|nr:double-strand break repair protein AddB [Sneathiella sp.]
MTISLDVKPTLFNIAPEFPFVDCLAKELLRRHGENLEELGRITILTTTRRAARALQNAFLRETEGRPLLLPRMRPIGDVDEDELALDGNAGPASDMEASLDLPPAIDSLKRQLLLTRLIHQRHGDSMDFAQCAGLAGELASLTDQVQTEGLDFADLKNLVPDEYASHWQLTLEFLSIISDVWPTILEAEESIDPAHRRDLLLRTQTEEWRKNPPTDPIYAVGSTGSIPATAELLHLVALLPKGCVILPGLDRHLDEESWEQVQETSSHPQYGLSRLLAKMNVSRDEVQEIQLAEMQSSPIGRAQILSEAMRPAETTDRWQLAEKPSRDALENVRQLNCTGPQAEAQTIALLMRETLEHPTRTATLVTPDRDLSRRVSSELKRWDIEVDDSAGSSLDQSPPGVFMRLTARMMADGFSPVSFLAALKHPYASMGMARDAFRYSVRSFELAILRGPRPAPGLDGLRAAFQQAKIKKPQLDDLDEWFDRFIEVAKPFETIACEKEIDLGELLKAHIRFAEQLSERDEDDNPHIWRGHFGEAAANFVSELLRAADAVGTINPKGWPDLLDNLMTGRMVRARYGLHPRLQIWGPIEARLQRSDLMILGGLNEGSWPPDSGSDPWMSRPMRKEFKLPLPEKKVGLSAHDFQQAFCSKEVVITRSEKIDGTPMVPSRWLLRLETILKKFDLSLQGQEGPEFLFWQGQLDQPAAYKPVSAPRPTPPIAARPRRLSVTRIEKWIKDPYSIFADAILGLRPLNDIAEDPGASDKGTFIHAALEAFVRKYPKNIPADGVDQLLTMGREAFGDTLSYPAVWAFWWPRFERIAEWFVTFERERRSTFLTALVEEKGTIDIPGPAGFFTLSGTADRVDRNGIGEISILDYKTGSPPSLKEVDSGVSPQLALEAAMVARGGFDGLPPAKVIELAYIRLSGSSPAGEFRTASKKIPAEELAVAAYEGLQRLITQFDQESTPYLTKPRPEFEDRFNDYEHLARVKEWSSGGSDE